MSQGVTPPPACGEKTGWRLALAGFALAWLVLAWPWLSGELTIPWDAKAHFHPQLVFLAQSIHAGEWPFWTPFVFAGHPQIADPQSLIFSPPFLLLALLDPAPSLRAGDAAIFLTLAAGALALMAWARDRGLHPAAGLLIALCFAFGGSAAWRIQHLGQIMSLSWLALAFWCLSRTIERGQIRWGLLAGLFAALMVLGRDQVALLGVGLLVAAGLTWLVSAWRQGRPLRPVVIALVAGAILGALVIAPPVIWTALLQGDSNRLVIDAAGAGRGSLHPALLLNGVAPLLFGTAGPLEDYWGPPSPLWGPVDLYLARNMGHVYAGILPALLLLGALPFALRKADRDFVFIATAFAVTLVYALGRYTPIFDLVFATVPGIGLFRRPADATFVLGLLFALLAGLLLDRWLRDPRLPTRAILALAALLIVAALAAALGVTIAKDRLAFALPRLIEAAIWACAGLLVLWSLRRLRSPALVVMALGAFLTLDLWRANGPSESTALPAATYEVLEPSSRNETIALLKRLTQASAAPDRRDRVELTGLGFHWPNASLVHGLDNTLGYNPVRLRLFTQVTGAGDHVALPDQRQWSPAYPSWRSLMADLLGLRYIATGVEAERIDPRLQPGDLTLVARTADGFVYENPRALPRVLVVPTLRRTDEAAILERGQWPGFDPRREALIDAAAPVATTGDPTAPAGTARILAYGNTHIQIEADAPQGGFLVLNDVWHPWWRATVDARETPILRVNLMMRAVALPPGRHVVDFSFHPVAGALAQLRGR